VNHACNVIDVDTTGNNIGRNQGLNFALAERFQGSLALCLAAVTVNSRSFDAVVAQLLREAICAVAGANEHDR
jgi:hypothetical protein